MEKVRAYIRFTGQLDELNKKAKEMEDHISFGFDGEAQMVAHEIMVIIANIQHDIDTLIE